MSRTVLVLGKDSQVARALRDAAWPADIKPFYVGREINIENQELVIGLVRSLRPSTIVNTAAYTAVDKAESEPEAAFAANFGAVINIGKAAGIVGAAVIHLSTDYVFDGTRDAPYVETDAANPRSMYGRSKWAGESGLAALGVPQIILRTSTVYSQFERSLLQRVLVRQRLRHDLSGVTDRVICPTSASDLANAIVAIAEALPRVGAAGHGVFHFAGQPPASVFEFIAAVVERAAQLGLAPAQWVRPTVAADWPAPAPRPRNGALDCTKVEQVWGIRPLPWRVALDACLLRMAKQATVAA
ncbi:MAG: dTDP-4-dehydrorhamnose reductase [Alphaproteobacteria bacterium]|nr:dTDP-4-dehydrorhamnose reductase [Alphaproteobacteria bacterium]